MQAPEDYIKYDTHSEEGIEYYIGKMLIDGWELISTYNKLECDGTLSLSDNGYPVIAMIFKWVGEMPTKKLITDWISENEDIISTKLKNGLESMIGDVRYIEDVTSKRLGMQMWIGKTSIKEFEEIRYSKC